MTNHHARKMQAFKSLYFWKNRRNRVILKFPFLCWTPLSQGPFKENLSNRVDTYLFNKFITTIRLKANILNYLGKHHNEFDFKFFQWVWWNLLEVLLLVQGLFKHLFRVFIGIIVIWLENWIWIHGSRLWEKKNRSFSSFSSGKYRIKL